ncbi:hypothetical protein LG943_26320 [Streptomonospora sp. S1-112]|uniref:Teneurin NHL domain-containing protein n=1 Tax=Streptomonospora mangrovi TaxID=2883123 RepID=A0A9X3NTC2_9ACTN|nr:hypothetical protein [Streptomonospora mangrovi]MDA0567811.1 hypothetical protein [Streptomonospora mangrovi]
MPLGRAVRRLRRAVGAGRPAARGRLGALALAAALAILPAGCALPGAQARPGALDTVAGSGATGWLHGGYSGDAGPATQARLNGPRAIALSADGTLYIADTDNNRIRSVHPESGTVNTVAGGGSENWAQADSATAVALPEVTDLAVDPFGRVLYIASMLDNQVAAVDLHTGGIEILAGRTDGAAADARDRVDSATTVLWWPSGIDVGPNGTLYIADSGNRRILAVGPDHLRYDGRLRADSVRVIAGTGAERPAGSDGGNGGPATEATFGELGRLTVARDGTVYVVDGQRRLRSIDPYRHTIHDAWTGRLPPTPDAMAVDPREGTVYVADAATHRAMGFVPGRKEPYIVAGTGEPGFSADGTPANDALLHAPGGIALSPSGDLYLADTHNQRIRRIPDIRALTPDPAT